jgi:hypothetical protein
MANSVRSTNLLGTSDYIAIAGVLATALGAMATWLVMKRQFASKRLAYSFEVEPIVRNSDPDLSRDLKIFFKGEELPEPALLDIRITNTGYIAIEKAEVVVALPGVTYLIPGYFVDIPDGYSRLWDIERTDAEECTIKLEHINPKQVARVRLLMDELPKGEPRISCAMPNVECKRSR